MEEDFETVQGGDNPDYEVESGYVDYEAQFEDEDYPFIEDWISQLDLFGRDKILCNREPVNNNENDHLVIMEDNLKEYKEKDDQNINNGYDKFFIFKWTVNIGSSVGYGPKIFDYYGEARSGWSASYCLFGVDYLPGGNPAIMPNIGISWNSLVSASYGFAGSENGIASSVSFRVLAFEVSGTLSVDSDLIVQKMQNDINMLYNYHGPYRVP